MASDSEKTPGKKQKKSKGKKFWLILVIVAVVLAGSGTGAYVYFHKPGVEAGETKKKAKTAELESLEMGELIVNLAMDSSNHFLRVNVVVEYPQDKKLTEEIKKKKHIISDSIITTLRSKSLSEIGSASSVQTLKSDILKEVNNNLYYGDITGIYFTDFLIQ